MKFDKKLFHKDGEYVTYGANRTFIARFKYLKSEKAAFITFLIKNFTVEEYLGRHKAGEAPQAILESKGYLQPHIKKLLTEGGYTVDRTGYQQYITNQVNITRERLGLSQVTREELYAAAGL